MTAAHRLLALALALLVSAACTRRDAPRVERVVADRDTLVIYGPLLTLLPVRITDRQGVEVPRNRADVTLSSDTALVSRSGGVECKRDGSATLTVRYREAVASLVAVCREATSFHGQSSIALQLRGPGQPISLKAVLRSGAVETVRVVAATVRDTAVARVDDGLITPLAVGRTPITAQIGGVRTVVWVTVTDDIFRDTISLAPGEFRTWRLAPGLYAITVRAVRGGLDARSVRMEAEGLRCAPDSDEDTINCIVKREGAVAMRNLRADPRAGRQVATVSIVRTPQ